MTNSNIVICSFYTADDYYRAHGERLKQNLESLGVEYVLREIEKKEGEDWAANSRFEPLGLLSPKKVSNLAVTYAGNPDFGAPLVMSMVTRLFLPW